MFRSLIRFEFVWIFGVRECSNLICSTCSSPVFPAPCIEETIFLSFIVQSCLLYHRLVGHRCMGLFLGFLCSSVDLCVWCFARHKMCCCCVLFCFVFAVLITVTLQYSRNWGCDTFSFVLSPQDCFGNLRSFVVVHEFQDYLFYFCEKCYEYFDGVVLNLQITLSNMTILVILILPVQEDQEIFFHFFVSSPLSFHDFSECRSFIFLVKFISGYFILFDTALNGICLKNFLIIHYCCIEKQQISVY